MNKVDTIQTSRDMRYQPNSKIVITNWTGRLGNNLMQLSNCIYICLRYNCSLDYPPHRFIKQAKIDFRKEQKLNGYYFGLFYYRRDCREIYPTLPERRYIMLNYVRGLLKIDLDHEPLGPDPERLVLQIRAGDTFNTISPPKYVPSPIAFHRKIIQQFPNKDIVVVCEDRKNPVIDQLEKEFDNCRVQSSSLENDIQTIINARHLVLSVGTFGFTLAMLSTKIKNIYVDDIPGDILDFGFFNKWELGLDFKVNRYKLRNYIRFKHWKNTPEQRQQIFDHKAEDVYPVMHRVGPEELANYYVTSWRTFYAEEGHNKLLEGLRKFIQVTEDEKENTKVLGIDVGANVGHYLKRHFPQLVKNENRLFLAFEPNPVNIPKLKRHINEMGNHDVRLFECCLSDKNGKVNFHNASGREDNREGNVVGAMNGQGAFICEVEAYRLDTILDEIKEEFIIKFLKIDTEGADTMIIKGMGEYIKKTKYIIFEASDTLDYPGGPGIENPLHDIVQYLDQHGFDTYRLGSEKMIPLNGKYWNKIYDQKKFWSNCFALRKGDPLIEKLINENFDYIY